jgi:predicted glycoside hydrolase/deacetylase ChbG (UPF0249 family)
VMLFDSIENLTDIFSAAIPYNVDDKEKTLAELLGYLPDDKLLIVNLDDFGLCDSTNRAVEYLIQDRLANSVSLLVTADGFDDAVTVLKKTDCAAGIHLALTTEWKNNIIRPVLPVDRIKSLLDDKSLFHSDIRKLYELGIIDEVEAECRAQIEKAIQSGIKIDHLDTHMGAMQLHPEYVDLYLRLAQQYQLPVRMGSIRLAEMMGLPPQMIQRAKKHMIVFPDNLIYIPMSFTADQNSRFKAYDYAVRNIPGGITEIYFHPSLNGADFQALAHHYSARSQLSYESIRHWDYEYLKSGRLKKIMNDENIIEISFVDLLKVKI